MQDGRAEVAAAAGEQAPGRHAGEVQQALQRGPQDGRGGGGGQVRANARGAEQVHDLPRWQVRGQVRGQNIAYSPF